MQTVEEALAGRWTEDDRGFGSPCWVWQRGCTTAGYAEAFAEGRVRYCHRLMYELYVGAIPDGLVLDHLCRVRNCINPAHLEPVTDFENRRRGGTMKLDWDKVREIRRSYVPRPPGRRSGGNTKELAKRFSISPEMVSAIVRGARWADPAT